MGLTVYLIELIESNKKISENVELMVRKETDVITPI
jgi:hypothetical protein